MKWNGHRDPNSSAQCSPLVIENLNTVQQPHRSSVAKSSVERLIVWIEKVLYVCETLDLKLLWLLLNDFPTQKNMTTHHTPTGEKSQTFQPFVYYTATEATPMCLTCGRQKKGCWGWEALGPLAAWFPAHWPNAGSLSSYPPCRSPSLSNTWIYIRSCDR